MIMQFYPYLLACGVFFYLVFEVGFLTRLYIRFISWVLRLNDWLDD